MFLNKNYIFLFFFCFQYILLLFNDLFFFDTIIVYIFSILSHLYLFKNLTYLKFRFTPNYLIFFICFFIIHIVNLLFNNFPENNMILINFFFMLISSLLLSFYFSSNYFFKLDLFYCFLIYILVISLSFFKIMLISEDLVFYNSVIGEYYLSWAYLNVFVCTVCIYSLIHFNYYYWSLIFVCVSFLLLFLIGAHGPLIALILSYISCIVKKRFLYYFIAFYSFLIILLISSIKYDFFIHFDWDSLFSGRLDIYSFVISSINMDFFGNGIFTLLKTENQVHNFILELFYGHGVYIGSLILLIFIFPLFFAKFSLFYILYMQNLVILIFSSSYILNYQFLILFLILIASVFNEKPVLHSRYTKSL